jgi:hypothetical protein
MTKDELLTRIGEARGRWDAALAGLDDAQLLQPGFAGQWTAKDVIAHIAWHEREMIGVCRTRTLAGSEWWSLSTDERNGAIFQANRERPLDEVRGEAAQVYAELLGALQTLSDEELVDAGRFADMPADWLPWQVIAGNTYEHYEDHLPAAHRSP